MFFSAHLNTEILKKSVSEHFSIFQTPCTFPDIVTYQQSLIPSIYISQHSDVCRINIFSSSGISYLVELELEIIWDDNNSCQVNKDLDMAMYKHTN